MTADGDLSGASVTLICNNTECGQRIDMDMNERYKVTDNEIINEEDTNETD